MHAGNKDLHGGPIDLRGRLKAATRPDHDEVELLYSTLDLGRREGLGCFLLAHYDALRQAYAAIEGSQDLPPAWRPPVLLHDLEEDLSALDLAAPPEGGPARSGQGSAIGVAYVVAGSRLGVRVLERRWAGSPDPRVMAAGRYLTSRAFEGYWPRFLDFLARQPRGDGIDAEIAHGARLTFRAFKDSFRAASAYLALQR